MSVLPDQEVSRRWVKNTCGYFCEGIPTDDSNGEGRGCVGGCILTVDGLRRGVGDVSSLWTDSGEGQNAY